jgi:hypothetical protein
MFFQANEGLTGAEWLKNGKVWRSIPVTARAENVYWYGYSPPASNLAVPHQSQPRRSAATSPTLALLGRYPNLQDAVTTNGSPAAADGIDFAWFLPLDQRHDSYRGCFNAAGTWWTAPAVAYEYTTQGYLNSRVSVLTCPLDSQGLPLHFNHLDFSWRRSADGTENVLTSLAGNFNNTGGVWWLPAEALQQPPAGIDGLFLASITMTFRRQPGC